MTALVLLGIGVRDLLVARLSGAAATAAAVAVLLATALATASGPALAGDTAAVLAPWPGLVVAVGAVLAWHALARAGAGARVGALSAVAVLGVAEHTGTLPAAPVPLFVTVLGAVAVVMETGNVATRDVLTLAGRPSTDRPAPEGGLRGGRYIGPMERLIMAALGLVAAWQAVAAIMAAKGIVRFPEISQDTRSGEVPGASAEEFLVGSLASWTLSAGAGLLVHAALSSG